LGTRLNEQLAEAAKSSAAAVSKLEQVRDGLQPIVDSVRLSPVSSQSRNFQSRLVEHLSRLAASREFETEILVTRTINKWNTLMRAVLTSRIDEVTEYREHPDSLETDRDEFLDQLGEGKEQGLLNAVPDSVFLSVDDAVVDPKREVGLSELYSMLLQDTRKIAELLGLSELLEQWETLQY
jgi:hypothetical protein